MSLDYDIPKCNASKIDVARFRLLFQWPLLVEAGPDHSVESQMQALHAALEADGHWQQTDDPAALPGEPADSTARQRDVYQERVYFHDFVQRFLYPEDPAAKVWRNDHYKTLTATIRDGDDTSLVTFDIRRLTLHPFQTGVAMISLELEHIPGDAPLKLATVQNTIDQLRRSYTPFWDEGAPGRVPARVELTDARGETTEGAPLDWPDDSDMASSLLRDIPEDDPRAVFAHWRKLIEPLVISRMAGADEAKDGLVWRDPSDERIPVNSFIWLAPKAHISGDTAPPAEQQALLALHDSDWARLADAEDSGGALHPYNTDFVEQTILGRAFYDRFLPSPGASDAIATRYITYGPHFSMVGASKPDPDQPPDFVSGWEKTATTHFRRHYASLTMIVRLEQAALLGISRRLTNLVHATRQDQARREAGIIELQDQFLEFTHRYRFTGVSSQVMPGELLTRLRDAAGVDALYDEVRAEIDGAAAAVAAHMVGLMGANLLMDRGELFDKAAPVSTLFKLSGVSAIAMSMIALAGLCMSKWKDLLKGPLAWIAFAGVVLVVVGLLAG